MSAQLESLTEEEIAVTAREIWQEEGEPNGKADEHWALAEEHLLCSRAAGADHHCV
jgi:hypothetical protein